MIIEDMFIPVALLVVAAMVIWLTTESAMIAIEKLASHTRLSKFTLALFVIGVVTSLPEIAITINSLVLNSPQIALGNLIGSQIFLLFLVIPVLAIVSRGLQLHTQMKNLSLVLMLVVAAVPILLLVNQSLDLGEVLIILGAYLVFVVTFFRQETCARVIQKYAKVSFVWESLRLIVSVGILFLASHTAVKELIEIAAGLQTPRFLLSMLILPIATNLPELSLALAALKAGRNTLTLGDFMGGITFNSLLIAVLAIFSGGSITIGQNISWVVLMFAIGLAVFWWACHSKAVLSIKEGLLLFLVYLALLVTAIWQIMSGILS